MADYSRTHKEISIFLKSKTQFFALECIASTFEKKAGSYKHKSFEILNRYDRNLFKGWFHLSMLLQEHWNLIIIQKKYYAITLFNALDLAFCLKNVVKL